MPRVVLMGPPGAGKGTQGIRLADAWGVPHVASGDLLRKVLEQGGDGELVKAASVITGGQMVSDDVASALVFREIDAASGFVLDGYPRNIAQAERLDAHLSARGERLDAVVALRVGEAELLRRLGGRLTCPNCGATYNLAKDPPKAAGVCDRCGHALVVRADDEPVAIRTRLNLYAERTRPLLDFYGKAGLLREVDAEGDENVVFERCRAAVADSAEI